LSGEPASMDRSKYFLLSLPLAGLLAFAIAGSATGKAPKLSADEIIAKHVASVGTEDARAALKSRVAQGTVQFSERITGTIHLDGKASIVSQANKVKVAFGFATPQYPGEQLVFDGQNVQVALIDQQSRSRLGNFVVQEPEVLKEGVFGGVLSMGWPLLDVKASGVKLKSEGIKKVADRELYALSYIPKKRNNSGDLSVLLYFDPATFHHVMTVYRLAAAPVEQGETTDPSSVTTTVEERFDDFHAVDGVTLPLSWDVRARVEPGKALEYEWKVTLSNVMHNKI
jgi:hypothetical protein